MSNEKAEKERKQVAETVEKLLGIKPSTLVRKEVLGEYSFEKELPLFEEIHDFYKEFDVAAINPVPEKTLQNINDYTSKIVDSFQRISSLKLAGTHGLSVDSSKLNLITELNQRWLSAYTSITPLLILDRRRLLNVESKEKEISRLETDFREMISNTLGDLKQANIQKDELLDALKTAAAEGGVSRQSIHFSGLCKQFRNLCIMWVIFAVLFGVAIGIYALCGFKPLIGDVTWQSLINHFGPRLVTISVLFTGLVFCVRNFLAASHNLTVNRHRQVALDTFETFRSASKDDRVKDFILMEAAKTIFAHQSTGYLKGEADSPQFNQITEVVKGKLDGG